MDLSAYKRIIPLGLLAFTTAAGAVDTSPVPDIQANGSDGPVTVAPDDTLQVTVSLDPGTSAGVQADWWVLAETPSGWYHYDRTAWKPGRDVTYQGPLFALPATDVLNAAGLPLGLYTVYFGVDVIRNGSIDLGAGYYDALDISVSNFNPLNDTGITWGGSYPDGNNTGCTSDGTIAAPQDCDFGRDAEALAGTLDKVGAGHGGFDFTKLDAEGNELSANAPAWSCVRDNNTGLVWEVKTDDGGIHDKDNTYRWGGESALGSGYGTYYTDWNVLVNGTNGEALCGLTDWRVPTVKELKGLQSMDRISPSVDTDYFPNTPPSFHWTSTPSAYSPDRAWYVYFFWSNADDGNRTDYLSVRLVSSGG